MIDAPKLLVLNPNEFELWKMMIEQYFLMTDYALWEVILNGDSPLPTRSVEGVKTPYPPTTIKEKLAMKNELKARVNTAHGVFATNSKTNASNLPNVDSLSDAVIYSFFVSQSNSPKLDNEDLKQINPDDLEEIDLKWQMAMTSKHQDNRNKEAPKRTVPFKLFLLWVSQDTILNALVSQYDGLGYDWSDQAKDGPTNFALIPHTSLSSSSSLNSDTKVSTCSKVYLKSYETLKEYYDNLTKDFNKSQFNLVSQQSDKSKTGLGYDSSGFDSPVLENQVNKKYNTGEGYHVVPPSYIWNFMPFKLDLVFADEHVVSESVTSLLDITKSKVKTSETKTKNVSAPIIKDWVSDSEDKNEIETEFKQIKPSFAKEKFVKSAKHVKSPRKSVKQEESNMQTKYPRKTSQSPKGNQRN
nr:hypothetical protein [Tanacetum cinerariifolium]